METKGKQKGNMKNKKYIITTIQEVKRSYVRDDCDGEYTMEECQQNFESESFNGTELDVEYDDETVIKIEEYKGKVE